MTFLHKLSNRLARLKAPLVLLLAVLSCERPLRTTDASSGVVTRIALSPKNVTLFPNQTTDITAVGFTAAGDTAMGIGVSWSVTGGTIIDTSTSNGRHYGRYKSGTQLGRYKVTATSSGTSDSAAVTVTQVPVATVAVTPAAASTTVGQAVQLTATPRDSTGAPLSGRTVTWASSNPGVATVNVSGLVTGAAAGSATITATSETKSGTSAITITVVPVASVAVSPASASVSAGQAVQLAATPRDTNGITLSGRVVTWSTSNAAVATVNGSGLVTGVATGSATITATSEGKSGTATVTVNGVPVASVTVSPATASIMVGQTVQLTATPKDANGNVLTGRVVTWTISNAGVATVNGTGLVTALAAGAAIITAACESANGTAAITSTNVPVASVTVSPPTATVTVGQTVQLTATPRDASGNPLSGRVITWASSSPTVATVNSGGLVTAPAVGTATITATSEGQSGASAITVTVPPPPPGGTWPNDPLSLGVAGWILVTDYGLTDPLPVGAGVRLSGGWGIDNQSGLATRITDPTAPAPASPPYVAQYTYPIGFVAGDSPAGVYYEPLPTGINELYIGFYWKPSNPWQDHPAGNKIAFQFAGGGGAGGQTFIMMTTPSHTLRPTLEFTTDLGRNLEPNVNQTAISLGQWHLIEWYMNKATHTMKWWLDGVLQGNYTNVNYPANQFDTFTLDPTWGGIGGTKTETDYYWYDHVRLTRR